MDLLIAKIAEYLGSPGKMGLTSISSTAFGSVIAKVSFGTLDYANIALQHTAWIVGIVAGFIAIVNGIDKLIRNHRGNKNNNSDDI